MDYINDRLLELIQLELASNILQVVSSLVCKNTKLIRDSISRES